MSLPIEIESVPWMDQAACADTGPDLFFPERGRSTQPAKNICTTCPVRTECRDYALDHGIKFGIWGGMSERERRTIRRQRRHLKALEP